MYAMIVKRDSYGKRAVWITYKEHSEKKFRDYLSDLGALHPLVYTQALYDVALSQVEPYKNLEEVADDVRVTYKYLSKLYGVEV